MYLNRIFSSSISLRRTMQASGRMTKRLPFSSVAVISTESFSSLPGVSVETKRAISELMKFEFMTTVQSMCIPPLQGGLDCLVKSKTGTGKTLAFLIPAIERVLLLPGGRSGISILVLAPTRELANQIAAEAKVLLHFHVDTKVAVFVGGKSMKQDQKQLESAVTVLVSTPGRLLDHLENTDSFSTLLSGVNVLVIDEADRLLDMGFKPAIDKILASLPPKKKLQKLLFSATIPASVTAIAKVALNQSFTTIDTTGLGSSDSGAPHLHVLQEFVTAPINRMIPTIASVLNQQMNCAPGTDYKIIVFFPTARTVGFMATVFAAAGLNVLEMHSRLAQNKRDSVSEQFRCGKNIIMFSSDVTARGMDYPGVTFVLQVGIAEKEQYIHRLGRTARAGAEGRGLILVSDFEERFMRLELKDLPLNFKDLQSFEDLALMGERYKIVLQSLLQKNPNYALITQRSYSAWLGFYLSYLKRLNLNKEQLVQLANQMASEVMALPEVPAIDSMSVGKMGLKGVPGLIVEKRTKVNPV